MTKPPSFLDKLTELFTRKPKEPIRLTEEEWKKLAEHVARQEALKFSESDLSRIAHHIVRESTNVDRLSLTIVKSRPFLWGLTVLVIIAAVGAAFGYWRLWVSIKTKVEKDKATFFDDLTKSNKAALVTAQTQISNQIVETLKLPMYTNIVLTVVTNTANELLKSQISPTIEGFKLNLTNELLTLRRMFAPRMLHFTDSEREEFLEYLKTCPKGKIRIASIDPKGASYIKPMLVTIDGIRDTLIKSGYEEPGPDEVFQQNEKLKYFSVSSYSVYLFVKDQSHPPAHMKCLKDAFNHIGLPAIDLPDIKYYVNDASMGQDDLIIFFVNPMVGP